MFIPFAFQGTQASSGDADATAYINEVIAQGGTLSSAEETAIEAFYTNLKSAGIYTKLHVFYPFLGGTSTSNAVEGKDPGGTYDISFVGTWQHSITGSSTTQTAGFHAETNFNPSASADLVNNFSFGVYTLAPGGGTGNGYHGLGNGTSNYVLLGAVDTRTSYQFYNGTANERVANTTGDWNAGQHFFQSRTANNAVFGGYADTITGDTITTGSTQTGAYSTPTNLTLWFGSNNGNDIELGGEMRFGWAGEGFDYNELQTLSTEINNLQIAFQRNVYGGDFVQDGLTRYYDINEASSYPTSGSTIFDLSLSNVSASLYNTYSYNSSNNSIDTTGTDASGGYLGFTAPLPFSSDFTVEYGVERTSGELISWTSRASNGGYAWGQNGTNYAATIYTVADNVMDAAVSAGMPINTPMVFTFVADGTAATADVYIDGLIVQSGLTYQSNRPSPTLSIPNYALLGGKMPNGTSVVPTDTNPMSFYYHRIYNRKLTAAEVLKNFNYNKAAMGLAYDPDVNTFITEVESAGGTLTLTEKDALNDMVVSFKTESLWTGFDFLFPFVGNVEASNELSMVNTSTYSGSFSVAGWTYDADGVTGAGSAQMTTNIPDNLSYNGAYGVGMYVGNNVQSTDGFRDSANDVLLNPRNASDNAQARFSTSSAGIQSIASTDSTGHWLLYANGGALGTGMAKNAVSLTADGSASRPNSGNLFRLGGTGFNFGVLYGGTSTLGSNRVIVNTIIQQFITDTSR